MKTFFTVAAATLALMTPAYADGDIAKGEKTFKKCKACHMIVSPEGETLYKGGKTGPNLYGVIGRTAGTGDFKYSKALIEAGAAGLVWDEETLVAFTANPKKFLKAQGTNGKTKMSFKLKKGGEDITAFLVSLSPAPVAEEAGDDVAEEAETEETTTTD